MNSFRLSSNQRVHPEILNAKPPGRKDARIFYFCGNTQRGTNSFYFGPDLPLFFVFSFVTIVSFVVEALNKVIDDMNLRGYSFTAPHQRVHPEILNAKPPGRKDARIFYFLAPWPLCACALGFGSSVTDSMAKDDSGKIPVSSSCHFASVYWQYQFEKGLP